MRRSQADDQPRESHPEKTLGNLFDTEMTTQLNRMSWKSPRQTAGTLEATPPSGSLAVVFNPQDLISTAALRSICRCHLARCSSVA